MRNRIKLVSVVIGVVALTFLILQFVVNGNGGGTSKAGSEGSTVSQIHDDSDSDHGDGHRHDEEQRGIELSDASIAAAGIIVEPLSFRSLESEVNAPGEVILNSYLSSAVTPRIPAQIVRRQAHLGDIVAQGQPLATLSSVEMAEAVSELLVGQKEWKRVEELGASIVSARRYSEAKIFYEQARNKAIAFGMSETQIEAIIEAGTVRNPGEFELTAPQKGTIISDEFVVGELIEPGRTIFDIVDETVLWVESSLAPDVAGEIRIGSAARVRSPNDGWLAAKVVQKHHRLDEETRTIGIRLEVNNLEDHLHPGTFVEARISAGPAHQHLAVPTAAILKSSDGDWTVFVEVERGHFEPQEVEVVRSAGDLSIITGLAEGTPIVVQGAFFVQSELQKSGFDIHDH